MDPVTVILAALVAGVGAGVGDVVPQAIKDAYDGLRELLRKKFDGDEEAEVVLRAHEKDPDTYEKPMAKKLKDTGAADDEAILAAAQSLNKAAQQSGLTTKYSVSVSGGKVGAIGDGNIVDM